MPHVSLRAASIVLVFAASATFPQRLFCQDDSKHAVPEKDELAASMKVVRDLFEDEYRATRTAQERSALAKKLVQGAIDTTDDPAGRYAILQLARDIAVAAADIETASLSVDTMAKYFQVDHMRLQASVLAQLARKPLAPSDGKQLVSRARELARQAVAADRYDLAKPLADVALGAARKMRDGALVREIVKEGQQIEQIEKQFQEVRDAWKVLETDPTNADANFNVGKFRCFVKGDWESGLPMLALGSDEQLRALAIEELKPSRTTAENVELADRWWQLAESEVDPHAVHLKRHAATYYRAAVGHLTGLPKIKIEKRLAELTQQDDSVATGAGDDRADEVWAPIGENGYLTQCYKLGPFPRGAVDDRAVLQFLARGKLDQEFLGTKLTRAKTDASKLHQFHGPAKDQRNHVMYFVFGLKSEKNQEVNLRATTFTRWEHSRVNVFLDFGRVATDGNLPLRMGKHTVIVMQHHLKSDRLGRSWITLAIRGETLQQAVILP